MSFCPVMSRCAGIFGHPFDTMSELAYQCSQSTSEFTPCGLEMASRLSRQPGDWQKRHVYPSSKQTADEAPSSLLEFLALSMQRSPLPLLLVLLVYHEIASLFVAKRMDTYHRVSCMGLCSSSRFRSTHCVLWSPRWSRCARTGTALEDRQRSVCGVRHFVPLLWTGGGSAARNENRVDLCQHALRHTGTSPEGTSNATAHSVPLCSLAAHPSARM
jgi:hypothetical protein